MKRIVSLLAGVLYIFNCSFIAGQYASVKEDVAGNQISKTDNSSVCFQTDRSWYLPGESVLFKAFILDGLNNRTFQKDDTLHLKMLDQFGLDIVSASLTVSNNLISGNIDLPDFLTEGNYILIAWLSSMNKLSPERFFSKILEIRKSLSYLLLTSLSLDDTLYESGSQMKVQLRFTDSESNPVPAGFSYQLIGQDEEIISGNNKASSEGNALLKLQLPKFDSKETLELIVNPSYKGLKNLIGVVVPTNFNRNIKLSEKAKDNSSSELKHLNIQLRSGSLIFGKTDKVQLEINVSDEKGAPVMANLSVSASNIVPVRYNMENEDFQSFISLQSYQPVSGSNLNINEYFTQYLIEKTQTPGRPFIIQEKNKSKKLRKKEVPNNQKRNTLFWGPEVLTDKNGKASVSFTNNGNSREVLVTVEGISADGTYGSSSLRYSVK
jgi:hypothetical protein